MAMSQYFHRQFKVYLLPWIEGTGRLCCLALLLCPFTSDLQELGPSDHGRT